MEQYTINKKFLTSVIVQYGWKGNGTNGDTISHVDHPSFAALRKHLAVQGLISIELRWHNGDEVLEPFSLNDKVFVKGEEFPCASALGFTISQKKSFTPVLYP